MPSIVAPYPGMPFRAAASPMTLPAATPTYASGDLVANHATAANVQALSFDCAQSDGQMVLVRRVQLRKSGTTVTNAQFRLHLWSVDPTLNSGVANGDDGVFSVKMSEYCGALDVTVDRAFSDGAAGVGVPVTGSEIFVPCANASQIVYGLLEARAAYTRAASEVFTAILSGFTG